MIYKCKMCGGDLEITGSEKTITCSFCGTNQTVPNVDEEKILQLYNRATHLLSLNEYDKASVIYEKILADQEEQAEAYWGLCLCKYGIEYVTDPKTSKKIPTCHRTLTNSILKDSDYKKAIELADSISKTLYESEAKYIDNVQKKILEISKTEDPYDIFICYKETGEDGKRTLDSVLAEEIYDELVKKDYRVFFSKISLEDKIGQEYEPFIFSALNSSKVMLVIGTKAEHFNAPWVKNEWSRFLNLCTNNQKKYLIPCYKGLSPYDMPEQFINLQSQDLDKIGYIQDLLKGIDKLINKSTKQKTNTASANLDEKHSLYNELRRMLLFINDSSKFNKDEYSEKWGILHTLEDPTDDYDAKKAPLSFALDFLYSNNLPNYDVEEINKALEAMWYLEDQDFDRLQKEEPILYEEITQFLERYSKNRESLEKLDKYNEALKLKKSAKTPEDYLKLSNLFAELGDFKDSIRQAEFYSNKANSILDSSVTEFVYENLKKRISKYNTESERLEIINGFKEIIDYKDSEKYVLSASLKSVDQLEEELSELEDKKQKLIDSNIEILELNKKIDCLKQELDTEITKINGALQSKKTLFDTEVSDIKSEISLTQQKLAKCGLFAIKEKNMLRDKLNLLEAEFIKTRKENNRQLQEYETESNNNIEKLNNSYIERINSITNEINQILSSNPEISDLITKISSKEDELLEARNRNDKSEKFENLWNPESVSIVKDYYGFDILCTDLGKYPQSKITIPSLVKDLKKCTKDNNGLVHLHGLEFYESGNEFFLVEPIQWKFIKYKDYNGKKYYLLSTRKILEVKGPIDKTNTGSLTKDNNSISVYKNSDIRKWLIGDFYKLAFNKNEDEIICKTVLDNSAESTSDEATIYFSENLDDKVFLLSYRASLKTHLADSMGEAIGGALDDEMEEMVNQENMNVDDMLGCLNKSRYQINIFEFESAKNAIYDDSNGELCIPYIYSEYSIIKAKSKNYQEGILLRSPDTESGTGYNICKTGFSGSCISNGGQFNNGKFDKINDICPYIIVCFEGNDDPISPDDSFDF